MGVIFRQLENASAMFNFFVFFDYHFDFFLNTV